MRLLCRALAIVAQSRAYAETLAMQARCEAYDRGFQDGLKTGKRRAISDKRTRTVECMHCKETFAVEESQLEMLAMLAKDSEHRREMWKAWCADECPSRHKWDHDTATIAD